MAAKTYFPKCFTTYGSRCNFPAHDGAPPVCREHIRCTHCRETTTYCECDEPGFPPILRCECGEYVMRHTVFWKAVENPEKPGTTTGWYQCKTCGVDLTEPTVKIEKVPFRLNDYSPNTMMILGSPTAMEVGT